FSIMISLNGNRRIRQTWPRSRPSLFVPHCTISQGGFLRRKTHIAQSTFGLKRKLLDCLISWQLLEAYLENPGHGTACFRRHETNRLRPSCSPAHADEVGDGPAAASLWCWHAR